MEYVTRAEWRARPPKRRFHTIKPTELLFLHHAAGYEWGGPSAVRDIQALHQDDRGWNDIAYNWLVDRDGTIYEGRGWFKAGGATKGWNTVSHSICYIGNAERHAPTPAALASIAVVGAEAFRLMGSQEWRPHQAVSSTLCPGKYLLGWLLEGGPLKEEAAVPASWQDREAFVLGIRNAYELTGPNRRTPTSEDMEYWLMRYDNDDDPGWLLAACKAGLRSEQ